MQQGDRFDEYTLKRRLGEGGFGEVWEAEGAQGERAALKVPTHPEAVRALRKEGRLGEQLSHPHIVPCLGVRAEHEPPYAVFTLVEGQSLSEVLRERGTIPWPKAVGILSEVLGALEHAHASGVVHRDVKPGNILIGANGSAYLTDFGLGRAMEQAAQSVSLSRSEAGSARIEGTLRYMAPEQAAGKEATPATDVHAVGVVLHEMVTGDATRLRFPMANAPRWLSVIAQRATHPDPEKRFADAGAMRQAIKLQSLGKAGAFPRIAARPWKVNLARGVLTWLILAGIWWWTDHSSRPPAIVWPAPPKEVTPPRTPEPQPALAVPLGPRLSAVATIRARQGPLSCLALSGDGTLVAAGGTRNGLQVWELPSARETMRSPQEVGATSLAFGHKKAWVFAGCLDGSIRAWDALGDQEAFRLTGHKDAVKALALTEDDAWLVSEGRDATVRLWNLGTHSEAGRLFDDETLRAEDHTAAPFLALHGSTVLARDVRGWVQEWDLRTMRKGGTFRAMVQGGGPIAFHPDGKRVACAGFMNSVEVWEAASGHCDSEYSATGLWPVGLAFSPGGRYLAACGPEPCVWDMRYGQRLPAEEGDPVQACAVALTRDSLLAACADGTVRVWKLPKTE